MTGLPVRAMAADKSSQWAAKIMSAAVVLVVTALAGRLAWELLSPLLGYVMVLITLGVIYAMILGRFRRP